MSEDKQKNIELARKCIEKHESECLRLENISHSKHHIGMFLGRDALNQINIFWMSFRPALHWKIGFCAYQISINQTHQDFKNEVKMVYETHKQMAEENFNKFENQNKIIDLNTVEKASNFS